MNSTFSGERQCSRVLEQLDFHLDDELTPEARAEVSAHLGGCAACAGEREARLALRTRLRSAVRSMAVSPALETRVRASLSSGQRARVSPSWQRPLLALAAAAAVVSGLALSYQSGHLRLTPESQHGYFLSLAGQVDGLMRVGLSDHIHCAYFRKYTKDPPSLPQMIEDMGPDYKPLIDVVKQNIPSGYRVEQAHRCTSDHRKFVHVIAKNGSRIVSLIITRKQDGETFARQASQAVLAQSGKPVYEARAQRFEFAAMETRDHLVYVISDLDEAHNMEFLTAFAPGVQQVLRAVEGS